MASENKVPISLATLVFCDTVDEIWDGFYDASVISALRFGVFVGILTDAFKKTVSNIKLEDEAAIDEVISKYLQHKNYREEISELRDEVVQLEQEIDKRDLFDSLARQLLSKYYPNFEAGEVPSPDSASDSEMELLQEFLRFKEWQKKNKAEDQLV